MPVVRLDALSQALDLAKSVLDPARTDPVVCVSTKHGEADPLIDVDALATAVGTLPVHVMPTGELTWQLTAELPPGLEVYGGAIRIWWPGLQPEDDPRRHPLIFCWKSYDAAAASARVLRELSQHGWAVADGDAFAVAPRATETRASVVDAFSEVAPGRRLSARVVEVFPSGVEVELAGIRTMIRKPRGRGSTAPHKPGESVPVRVVSANQARRTVELCWADEPEARPKAPSPADIARLHGVRGTIAAPAGAAKPQNPAPSGTVDLEPFRTEARDIIRTLHKELAAARSAIDDFAAEKMGDIVDALKLELAGARAEARSLLLRLNMAEKDKRNAIDEMHKHRDRAQEAEKKAKREHDKRSHAETLLHGYGVHDDPHEQLRHEITVAVQHLAPGLGLSADSAREYSFGPKFLRSVEELQGIDRPDIVDKIARLLLDAPNLSGHALRTSDAGNAPQEIRPSDGAKAFRIKLQQGTASARRLHYWQRGDGSIELSVVGVHDDMSIH